MSESAMRRTPLYSRYANHEGVRCIDFGGWELPVQFSGIQKEHEAVRERAGLFDVSHMGEFFVEGVEAERFLQHMTTNDVTQLEPGKAQYTLLCYPDGGVVDDLLIYMLNPGKYMLVVNASNIEKDWNWLQRHLPTEGVTMCNESDETALLAVQGPLSSSLLSSLCEGTDPLALRPFTFILDARVAGIPVLLSRTGYTGEDGFELYVAADQAEALWDLLMEAGEAYGLLPAGLGARDTLRFEACLPLYGQELGPDISPLEAGLNRFIKLEQDDFIGRDALVKQRDAGIPRRLVGLEMIDRGIPRTHYPVFAESSEEPIGEVTTGTQSPTLKKNLGLAILASRYSVPDTILEIEIRGKRLKAKVVPLPFYRRNLSAKR
ncbi:MAG: glycine cleavage system aminomethyltransferase GcvT [Paenibacillaceae bacterium]|uniref:Aminomethyltransferase n=1 Tax=Paenibacillus mellifer TaxID=2937794 RepID=A0A9X2BSQ2_9BACL|nr:glycine cleavage system aminomethyltransferase GcvT [Paenibacillus mellifer]MBW4837882.1 glycine cleavage system aminomethyltransferase GcvT [Paenibacillaceae bacterium]MCK8490067.1 glycine cleavage system aminomethyltransferase GcvT [Paenibacillus mellifer]